MCIRDRTRTGGVVNFDLLHEDRERKIPSMLIAGAGNGKMKLLGNLIDTYFANGHTIFNIDPVSYTHLQSA